MKRKKIYPINESVKLSSIQKMIEALGQKTVPEQDPDVSFEFLMASLFPRIWFNIQEKMRNCYTEGYLQGMGDKNDKNKRTNK
jgi:hypothetical protein